MKAKVFSGKGVATKIMKDYVGVFRSAFGIDVFPGTLNIIFDEDVDTSKWDFIHGFKKPDGSTRGGVFYRRGILEKEAVFFIRPEFTSHGKNVLEVVSGINIRDKLGLKEGSVVECFF